MSKKTQLRFCLPLLALLCNAGAVFGQSGDVTPRIPKSLGDQFFYDGKGVLQLSKNGQTRPVLGNTDKFTLEDLMGHPTGADTGILLDFGQADFNGTVPYGPYMEEASIQRSPIIRRP